MRIDYTHIQWRKSSRSNDMSACVELAAVSDGHRALRDSKLGAASPVVAVPAVAMTALLDGIKAGKIG